MPINPQAINYEKVGDHLRRYLSSPLLTLSLHSSRKSKTLLRKTWSSFARLSTWSSCQLSNTKNAVTSFLNYRYALAKKLNFAIWSSSAACKTGHTYPFTGILDRDSAGYKRSIEKSLANYSPASMKAFIDWSRASCATWLASLPT